MPRKKENTKQPKAKPVKEEYVTVCLPQYQKDLSPLMTPENRRPEIEDLVKAMVAKHKGKSLRKAS